METGIQKGLLMIGKCLHVQTLLKGFVIMTVASIQRDTDISAPAPNTLLTFKEAMQYLRVSRSTLYRLMYSDQLVGHKVGSQWRFYLADLQVCVRAAAPAISHVKSVPQNDEQANALVAMSR
jgi:excisionase family DNA binding protein